MSAAKMKTAPSAATTATTDANERIRKQQQQQQQQDDKIANNFATSSAAAATATSDATVASTSNTAAAATTLRGARRNHTRKLRSASGDDIKRQTTTTAKRKRHVNFSSPNTKSKIRLTTAKTKSQTNAASAKDTVGSQLPTVETSKSILKVKHVTVLKRKAGTNKVTKKLKKVPQGAQAEYEAAELSKLQQQFATKLPETPSAPASTPNELSVERSNAPTTSSSENVQGASKRRSSGKRLLKRRHSGGTKHVTGVGIVESGSVNVPPVRRFSPVHDKTALNTHASKVYDGAEMFADNNLKSYETIPTTSNNITVAMVKETHNAKPKNTNSEEAPAAATTNDATASNTVVTNVAAVDVDNSGVVGGGGSAPIAEELQNSLTPPSVVPIAEPISTAPSTKNKRRKRS
ncbi:uncharacterized protein LOC105227648 isoform X2 [Bactrocera dorsalis]|uniref:Uncharacterized protein LOC105227648 isoform X2 n=1 Tax=Bactrocera dorsalis TaxID=27457 RepID=A0ABM3J633_BACDO|nr:uncharacterized protein LOC105227648 isoform X2 [Bactrocera dorsalis]